MPTWEASQHKKNAQAEVKKLRSSLNKRKGDWGNISRETGLGYRWIVAFARGDIKDPGYTMFRRLELALEVRDR